MDLKMLGRQRVNQRNRFLKMKRLTYLLATNDFEEAWKTASDEDLNFVNTAIENMDIDVLKAWTLRNVKDDILDMRNHQLQNLAIKLGIPKVFKKSRFDLIQAIREMRNDV